MTLPQLIYKVYWKSRTDIAPIFHTLITKAIFKMNNIQFGNGLRARGIPIVNVSIEGKFTIGNNVIISNGPIFSPTGRSNQCEFKVSKNANLEIGNNVGLNSVAIACSKYIKIGDGVMIGGNAAIYDTNFHSLDFEDRASPLRDRANVETAKVIIENNVFIGAHTTILKGVTIGANSIIGACSVVTKDIPANQVWGGNPAKFLKNLWKEK